MGPSQEADEFPVHRKPRQLLDMFNYYARRRDEEGFKEFLSEIKLQPGDKRYAAAMSAFWNLVRSIENETSR
jgi:hypothetical protein